MELTNYLRSYKYNIGTLYRLDADILENPECHRNTKQDGVNFTIHHMTETLQEKK